MLFKHFVYMPRVVTCVSSQTTVMSHAACRSLISVSLGFERYNWVTLAIPCDNT